MKPEYYHLVQFFGSYFHQDWRLDNSTPDKVIEHFIEKNPKDEVQTVAKELGELLSLSLTEDELKRVLFEELLCYYLPMNSSVRSWLTRVHTLLAGEH